jgi:hypothetical protein
VAAVRTWKLIALVAADLVLIAAVLFGVVVATAADRPTETQGAIAWSLLAVALLLIAALVVLLIFGLRRVIRRALGGLDAP